jgi:hypothetical protein
MLRLIDMGTHTSNTDQDINLVEIWLRRDPKRWLAGALAGVFSAFAACGFAMIISTLFGSDPWYPAKLLAIPFCGASAMNLGFGLSVLVGLGFWSVLGGFLGAVFAHFTGTNSLSALLGVGLSWGAFSWVFLHNLFFPSFREYMVQRVPNGVAFFTCMVFGVALTSTAFFDRKVR